MSRKTKAGIDYFSHDVDILQDKKIKLIKAKHGLIGYAVYLRLLEEVYRESGYYIKIDEDFNILFSDDNNLDYDVYILILNDCVEKDLFNEKIYKKYGILTSTRVQLNYCAATDRRSKVEFIKEYLLIKPSEEYPEKVIVSIKGLNVNNEELNAHPSAQSKGKERTLKERKEINGGFFDRFWKSYPRKQSKAQAKKIFEKLAPDENMLIIILKAIEDQKNTDDWKKDNGKYIPHPSTWLNQERWEDETIITSVTKKTKELTQEELNDTSD